MSCVIGLVTDGKILMAADSGVCDGNVIVSSSFKKISVFHTPQGKMAVGLVGHMLPNQIIHNFFVPPSTELKTVDYGSVDKYILKHVLPAMKKLLIEHDAFDQRDPDYITGLIGYRGGLYFFDSYLSAMKSINGYEAIGTGREVALGSLYTTQFIEQYLPNMPGGKRVEYAMGAAINLTAFVGGDMQMVEV